MFFLSKIVLVTSIFCLCSCYGNKYNLYDDLPPVFKTCKQVKENLFRCFLDETHDYSTLRGYSCDGDACVFYLSTPSKFELYGNNNMPYALCSASSCTRDTKNQSYAMCTCPVITEGGLYSMSISDTRRRDSLPVYNATPDAIGIMSEVTSTFSLANIEGFENMNVKDFKYPPVTACVYNESHPFAECQSAPCQVDPNDPSKAICKCTILEDKAFISMSEDACDPDILYAGKSLELYHLSVISIVYRHFGTELLRNK